MIKKEAVKRGIQGKKNKFKEEKKMPESIEKVVKNFGTNPEEILYGPKKKEPNMREKIIIALKTGPKTAEELMEASGAKTKPSLSSQITYVKMGPNFVIYNRVEKTYKLVTEEEFDLYESEKEKTKAKVARVKTDPKALLKKAQDKETRASSALDRFKAKHLADPEDTYKALKFKRAEIDSTLTSMDLGKIEAYIREIEGTDK